MNGNSVLLRFALSKCGSGCFPCLVRRNSRYDKWVISVFPIALLSNPHISAHAQTKCEKEQIISLNIHDIMFGAQQTHLGRLRKCFSLKFPL